MPPTATAEPKPTDLAGRVRELVSRNFDCAEGELLVGGIPIRKLAAKYGTPAFFYDQSVLSSTWQRLRETLPERFSICYSVKANPNQAILQFFVAQGAGLEIASSGELVQALASGCPADRILFAGPGKTDEELAAAIGHGIGEIHVESLNEARRIETLASKAGRTVTVSLRVNPSAAVEGGSMRMGAKAVPFGIDEDQLPEVLAELAHLSHLNVVGLHLFMGTQILDHEVLLRQYRAGLEIARRLAQSLKRPLETVDFGGGWGVPYFSHEQPLDLEKVRTGLQALVAEGAAMPGIEKTRFYVEPGRFLVAEAGVYVARVTDVKLSRGKKFVITDGGMNHHLAASGNLGQTIKRNFPVAVITRLDQPESETVEVAGPLCTPLDVLARAIELPPVEVGDLIGVFQSGAYARAASPLGFLSHRTPPEILVADGVDRLVRRRGCDEDYLQDQIFENTFSTSTDHR